jgi:hypothetical protein
MPDKYRTALNLMVEGIDPTDVHGLTGVPIETLWGMSDALDGEAAGTMNRFGSIIDPRYRPRVRTTTDNRWTATGYRARSSRPTGRQSKDLITR